MAECRFPFVAASSLLVSPARTGICAGDTPFTVDGAYTEKGVHNGKPYFTRDSGTYNLYWNISIVSYMISDGFLEWPAVSWSRYGGELEGVYDRYVGPPY